jgi:hypothetical protein
VLERDVLGEAALSQRVDLVLAALAQPAPPAGAAPAPRRRRPAAADADKPRARPSRKIAGRTP